MKLALKIAWRNIWKHKGKSIIIGIILFIGSFLMTIGNAFITGMEKGMEKNIVNSFTGDIVIISDEQEKDNVLMDVMSGKPLKTLENYDKIEKTLAEKNSIEKYLPAMAGMVFVFNPEADMGNTFLLGVDLKKYKEMFPDNMEILEGRELKPGEKGLLVNSYTREKVFDFLDFWLVAKGEKLNKKNLSEDARKSLEEYGEIPTKDNMVFMGASTSNATMDVRSEVKGIFKFKALNKIWGFYSIVDVDTFRECHGYITGSDEVVKLTDGQENLLNSSGEEDVFGDNMFENVPENEEEFDIDKMKKVTERKIDTSKVDSGVYNLMFVKIKSGEKSKKVIEDLNKIFKDKNINARAITWKRSVGMIGSMAVMIKGALTVFIMFIFFVAIIVIMNALSMAAIERTSEIAMMRAIGARKWFTRQMFIAETGFLAFFFGAIGMGAGILTVFILKKLNIVTDNDFLQLVYGGDKLNPVIGFLDLGIGVIELVIVTILAVLYPLKVLGKIVPLDAISRD